MGARLDHQGDKQLKTLLTAAVLALAATSCLAEGAAPIKIVGSLDLSGAAADVGKDVLAAAQYAIEQVNKSGGVLGRRLTLEYEDGGSNPQRAVSQANTMVSRGAAMLLAPQSSASALAVSKAVSAKARIPMCVNVSIADDLTMRDFQPYVFSVMPSSYMEGRAQAARLAKLPYKRYALLSADYAGGRSVVTRFKERLKELNPQAEIVVEEYPKFGATDYTATINKLLAAKPDYVFSILFGSDLLTFSKQASALGFFQQINNRFMAAYDFNTLKALGQNAAVGTEGLQRAPANYLLKGPGEDFVASFKAKTGAYPSDWQVMTYDCIASWAQAVKAAKTTDANAVMRAIESGEFHSARGNFRFGKLDHLAEVPVYMGKVEQSKEFGQPVIAIQDVIPASESRPSEALLQKERAGARN
jgi:branched-chain amino acid transport system substrate-binding protein